MCHRHCSANRGIGCRPYLLVYSLKEAGRNNLVGVHILERKRNAGGCYNVEFLFHFYLLSNCSSFVLDEKDLKFLRENNNSIEIRTKNSDFEESFLNYLTSIGLNIEIYNDSSNFDMLKLKKRDDDDFIVGRYGHTAILYNESIFIFGGFNGRMLNDMF